MAVRTRLGTKVNDGSSFTYTATLLQEDGVTPIDFTDANTDVDLTLWREDTDAPVNSRDGQSVIAAGVPANQHTGSAAGVLTFKATDADTSLSASEEVELVLRYEVAYQDGDTDDRLSIYEVSIIVAPLAAVA